MPNFQFNNLPPFPILPQNELNQGITTRVMAKKQILQLQKDMEEKTSLRNSISSRKNSKFLSGTSIPNSTIRSSLDASTLKIRTAEDKTVSDGVAKDSVETSEENEEKKRRLSEERGLERIRRKIRSLAANTEARIKMAEEKGKYFTVLAPTSKISQGKVRRSTLESIRTAIQQSPNHIIKLVNADSIEKSNIGQRFKANEPDPPPFRKLPEKPSKRDLQTQTSLPLDKLFN